MVTRSKIPSSLHPQQDFVLGFLWNQGDVFLRLQIVVHALRMTNHQLFKEVIPMAESFADDGDNIQSRKHKDEI